MNINYDIFISYRRLDELGNISGRDQARLIAKQLELEGYHPFFDYSEIKDNEFDKVILPAIENCKVFILVLTKDSLNRCKNDEDWVRKEIETALAAGCKIINVTPDNAFNGWPTTLPDTLYKIKTIQISDVHMGSLFETSVNKLIKERIIDGLEHYKGKSQDISLSQNDDDEFIDSIEVLHSEISPEEWYLKGYNSYYGKGIKRDSDYAVICFKRAAEQSHIEAQKFLSKCYSLGIGVSQCNEMAEYWMNRAASLNDIEAIYKNANISYNNGEYKQAYNDYLRIYNLQYEISLAKYAEISRRIMESSSWQQDKSFLQYIIKESCDNLYEIVSSSLEKLGNIQEYGLVGQKDYNQAKVWYKKLNALGKEKPLKDLLNKIKTEADVEILNELPDVLSDDECYELSNKYFEGKEIEKNPERGYMLLKRCAYKLGIEAMENLAKCHLFGIGCKKDFSESYKVYNDIVKLDPENSNALYQLALLQEFGDGTEQNIQSSITNLIKAVKLKHNKAIEHLYNLFYFGKITGERSPLESEICKSYSIWYQIDIKKINKSWVEYDTSFPSEQGKFGTLGIRMDLMYSSYIRGILEELNYLSILSYFDEVYILRDIKFVDEDLSKLTKIRERIIHDFNDLINNLNVEKFYDIDIDDFAHGACAIDLGLTSGILWSNMNIGQTDKIAGELFAWYESSPKDLFQWENYFDKRVKSNSRFQYINNNGTSSLPDTNAAKSKFGEFWTIPRKHDFEELINECEWELELHGNLKGYKIIGPNGKFIFLPINDIQKNIGLYWTHSIHKKDSKYAHCLYIDEKNKAIKAAQRYLGLLVRPIAVIDKYGNKNPKVNDFFF